MENESTSFRSSSRLREKERISYSEEEHIQFIEYLDPNNYPDEEAAIAADLPPYDLSDREKQIFPKLEKSPGAYLQIRNHILKKWHNDLSTYLTIEEASKGIQEKYKCFVPPVVKFLERFGYINTGVFTRKIEAEKKNQRIVIVGAGMAGLAASRQLSSFGYKVMLLEARSRVGGRVNTDDSLGASIDLGASIVTGLEGNPLTNVCKQLNIKLHKLEFQCPLFDLDGSPLNEDLDKKVEQEFNKIMQETRTKKSSLPKSLGKGLKYLRSFSSQEEIEERVFNWHIANLEYACATDLDDVSLSEWDQDDQYEWAGDHCLIPTGYSSIAKNLAENIPISFETVVQSVHYNKDGVCVYASNNKFYEADAVLITLPLGVLKEGSVKFSPPLPEAKLNAISNLGFGLLNKVVLLFPHVFWENEIDYFGQINPPEIRGQFYLFWNLHRCVGKPILVALLAGKCAYTAEEMEEELIIEKVMQILTIRFGEIPKPIKYIITRWKSDQFARGTYSYIGLNSEGKDYDRLAQPIANRVFFGGEATMRTHPATAAGAYLSGLVQAGLIDEVFGEKIELNFDVDALNREWELENSMYKTAKRKYTQKHEMKKSFQRGKKGLRFKETRLTETYSWLFSTSYRIPKRKPVESNLELSNSNNNNSSSSENNLKSSSDLILSTRKSIKEQKQQRIITKSSLENMNLCDIKSSSQSSSLLNSNVVSPTFSSFMYPSQFNNVPITVPSNVMYSSTLLRSGVSTFEPNLTTTNEFTSPPNHMFDLSPTNNYLSTTPSSKSQHHKKLDSNENQRSIPDFAGPAQTKEFKKKVGDVIVNCLCKYYSKDSLSKEEFKHLARKLTHLCLNKEKKHNAQCIMTEEVKKKITKFTLKFLDQLKKSKLNNLVNSDNSNNSSTT